MAFLSTSRLRTYPEDDGGGGGGGGERNDDDDDDDDDDDEAFDAHAFTPPADAAAAGGRMLSPGCAACAKRRADATAKSLRDADAVRAAAARAAAMRIGLGMVKEAAKATPLRLMQ